MILSYPPCRKPQSLMMVLMVAFSFGLGHVTERGADWSIAPGMFAVITPALMTGAFADRFRVKPYLIFIVLWLLSLALS